MTEDYTKLLNYCADIVKANIERFKDVPLSEIKAAIEIELEIYQEGEK